MAKPVSRPRPQYYIGFDTLAEAQNAQRICLEEPIEKVRYWIGKWGNQGKVVPVNNPEQVYPGEPTHWLPKGDDESESFGNAFMDAIKIYRERN